MGSISNTVNSSRHYYRLWVIYDCTKDINAIDFIYYNKWSPMFKVMIGIVQCN